MKALSILEAADVVKGGGVIAYPTETFYGLGVDPRNEKALENLFAVKERDRGKPISILIDSQSDLIDWIDDVSPQARRLMEKFWPGPLTMVLPAAPTVSKLLTAGSGNLGLRISPHPLVAKLMRELGAITTTSANLSGQEAILDPRDLQLMLGNKIDGYVDGGVLPPSRGSTIVSVLGDVVKVIREGEILIEK